MTFRSLTSINSPGEGILAPDPANFTPPPRTLWCGAAIYDRLRLGRRQELCGSAAQTQRFSLRRAGNARNRCVPVSLALSPSPLPRSSDKEDRSRSGRRQRRHGNGILEGAHR